MQIGGRVGTTLGGRLGGQLGRAPGASQSGASPGSAPGPPGISLRFRRPALGFGALERVNRSSPNSTPPALR